MSSIRFRNSAFPSLIHNFFNQGSPEGFDPIQGNYLPPVNILEKEVGMEIHLYAPGMKKEKFRIQQNPRSLSISYIEDQNQEETTEQYTRREFRTSSFQRTFNLPETIDKEKISARYEDGILMLTLPLKEESKAAQDRIIEIG
jgi:HSP20 family protein